MCGALVEHGKVNRSLTAGVTIDRILRDYPHGVSCCHDSHALESCWRLACQVDLAAVDHHGETALHLAIRGGSVDWFGSRRILACCVTFASLETCINLLPIAAYCICYRLWTAFMVVLEAKVQVLVQA